MKLPNLKRASTQINIDIKDNSKRKETYNNDNTPSVNKILYNISKQEDL